MCEIDGGWDDWGGITPLRFSTVKARKPHRCEVCGRRIQPGTFAHTYTAIWENSIDTLYLHLQCRNLTNEIQGTFVYQDALQLGEDEACGSEDWRERFLAVLPGEVEA